MVPGLKLMHRKSYSAGCVLQVERVGAPNKEGILKGSGDVSEQKEV